MAFATAKFSEMPLKISLPLTSYSQFSSFNLFVSKRIPSIHLLTPFASLHANESSRISPVARPLSSPDETVLNSAANLESETRSRTRFTNGERGQNAIDRIVLRLRNLGLGSDDEDCEEEAGINGVDSLSPTGEERLGDLLKREWIRPDKMLIETEKDEVLLPWEKEEAEEKQVVSVGAKKKTARAPTLAELTIEDEELRRLRRLGMYLRERINVPKAGTTQAVLEKIHDRWRKEELVRLKFHEVLATDMKTAHEIVERRTGGLVIWRSGSVMVVYRGTNYEGPYSKSQLVDKQGEALFIPDVSSASTAVTVDEHTATSTSTPIIRKLDQNKIITEEEAEYEGLLDGLGPRFVEWWGTGILPVDADLLPQKIPGYKTPYRLLPAGMRPRLTNAEMTNLRKLAKSLPCHFALGRNRNHQGLAVAILKLWEKSLVAKIAVKRGIQNTNNKLMAEEIKELTGGVLLLRNKYYIVIYRGKDFIPTSVSAVLSERQELTKQIQDVEERVRIKSIEASPSGEDKSQALAGTLAEFYEAQARWGANISAEDREKMIEEDNRSKRARLVRRIERKLAVAQAKKLRAEKLLAKIEASMIPAGPDYDQETITDEERVMFRRLGLRMKPYLPLGIRGVFDGVIENMHLHWKHRELVKLISKQKTLAFVEDSARLLEYESGGILVAIERVPKGFALIYYRGKNYRRPISIRPRNLLTKAKALKRSIAMQRHEALSQHISELEDAIENMKKEIGVSEDVKDTELDNVPESVECEDKSSYAESDDDVDFDDDDERDDSDTDWENDENF